MLLILHFQFLSTSSFPPFFLLPCFYGWMDDRATSNVLFYASIIWRSYTCWALVPYYQKQPPMCFIRVGIKFNVGLTKMTWHLLALWFDIIHTKNIYTTHIGTTVDWLINIYYSSLHLYYIKFNNMFAFQKLFTCRRHISAN